MKESKTPEEIQLELNNWLASIHNFGSIRQFYYVEESIKDAQKFFKDTPYKARRWPEDYNMDGIGEKSESDVFFQKFNTRLNDIDDILVLKKYLTDDELKERLTPKSYMYLQTENLANKYVLDLERKELEHQLNVKLVEIEELKKKIDPENYLSDRLICKQINDKFITITDKFTEAEYKFISNKRFNSDTEFYSTIENLKNTRNP